jgi:acetyl esterase
MKMTLRGIEQFFNFLGLKADASPEDYRRHREQMVFGLYKHVPEFLGGSARSRPSMSVTQVSDLREPLSVFIPLSPVLDKQGHVTVLLAFHGGAFIMGAHDTPAIVKLLQRLVDHTGVVAISANYGKAPENKFPRWSEDAQAAVDWVWTHLVTLDKFPLVSGFKLIVMGDSAGGNIACATAHANRDKISHQILLYPILNLATFDTPSWNTFGQPERHLLLTKTLAQEQCRNLFQDPQDAFLPQASPLHETDFTGVPEAHLIVGNFDPLRDDSLRYQAKLKEAGVPATVTVYSTAPHGWVSFPQASVEQEESLAELDSVVISFRDAETTTFKDFDAIGYQEPEGWMAAFEIKASK